MTLPGFSTVKREALEVTGAGVITVNGEMRVGGVQETITVTGESPIVDVQSTRRQQIVDDETLKALPATRGYNALVFLVPSITGGSNQIDLNPAMRIFYSHGGRGNEGRVSVDGLSVGSAFNGGGVSGYIVDTANSQEMQVALSGGLGETEMGGANVNFVPKTGGNTFSGNAFFSNAGQWSQGSNLDDRLKGFGLTDPPALYQTWDISGSVGGPIKRDKLWFFGNYRDIGSHDQILGMYANANAGNTNSWTYVPDKSLPARSAVATTIKAIRLTSQVTPKNKVGFYYDYQNQCNGSTLTHREAGRHLPHARQRLDRQRHHDERGAGSGQRRAGHERRRVRLRQHVPERHPGHLHVHAHQQAAVRSRRLELHEQVGLDGAAGRDSRPQIQVQEQNAIAGIDKQGNPFTMPANLTYRALDWNFNNMQNPTPWKAALSYVTGAHSMKFGYQGIYNRTDGFNHYNNNRLNYRFGAGLNARACGDNGIPNQFTMNYGDFLDQWTAASPRRSSRRTSGRWAG